MASLTVDNTRRHCSRCGLSLTDAASREAGVGPVCRAKDNHLYAKSIPANYTMAVATLLAMKDGEGLCEETVKVYKRLKATLIRRAERASRDSVDITKFHHTGEDLRKIITDLDWLCSWAHPARDAHSTFVSVIRHLGYVGLAAVIGGDASTSPSKVWFENGRIYMSGLGNTSGWRTMRKIPGIVTPRGRGDRTPYSAPADQFAPFALAVMTHWPLFEGDLDALRQECASFIANNPAAAKVVAGKTASSYVAKIVTRSSDFTLSFPWRKDRSMSEFLAALKSVPAAERSYDASTKMWSFKLAHLERVKGFCEKVYDQVSVSNPGTDTPEGLYVRKAPTRAASTWAQRHYRGPWRL